MKKLFIYRELRYRESGSETGGKEGGVKMSNVRPDPEIRYIPHERLHPNRTALICGISGQDGAYLDAAKN